MGVSKKHCTFASLLTKSPDGGIGRRAGLKHQCRKASRFEPGSGYSPKLSIPCKSLICKGFFFSLPSPSHPSASMAKPSDDSKYLVKKLCRDFDRTSERNRRFCAIGATKTRHPLVERHLWCCDWASFELRKASYRTTKDHLSTCDTCLTARGNVRRGASNEQP